MSELSVLKIVIKVHFVIPFFFFVSRAYLRLSRPLSLVPVWKGPRSLRVISRITRAFPPLISADKWTTIHTAARQDPERRKVSIRFTLSLTAQVEQEDKLDR
jgi:hypothetical protein